MDWDDAADVAEKVFEVLGPAIIAASRNRLIDGVPGFRRLDCDSSRWARFDPVTMTTTEAVCCSAEGEASQLVVSRFPVAAIGRAKIKHERTMASFLLATLVDHDEPVSAGWSGVLPGGLEPPAFLGVDSELAVHDEHQLVVLAIAIREDVEVVPALLAAGAWLSAFPAIKPSRKQPWSKHHLDAGHACVVALTKERIQTEREHGVERARFTELTTRAEAFRAGGQTAQMRRALEQRIESRVLVERLAARVAAIAGEAKRVRAELQS